MASNSDCMGDMEYPKEKDNYNTKKSTKGCKHLFEEYLTENNIKFPSNSEELSNVLKRFYVDARRRDGHQYSKNSLSSIRFGLKRHFKDVLRVDIVKDKEFREANRVYEAQCSEREGSTEHIPALNDEDIKKLYECGVFDTQNPTTLQNKVFFELMLFFCLRGRGILRQLKKDHFHIEVDDEGRKCVVKLSEDSDENEGVMMANNGPFCPVRSFEKYLSHLNPLNEFFFQRPKQSDQCNDVHVWYDNVVVGQQSLGKKMKFISQQAKLSNVYTNHSIRATAVTILNKCGFDPRCIMSVSGYKTESSVKSYMERQTNKS